MPLIMNELKQSAILNPNMDSYVIVIKRMILILRCSSLFSSSCNFFLCKNIYCEFFLNYMYNNVMLQKNHAR